MTPTEQARQIVDAWYRDDCGDGFMPDDRLIALEHRIAAALASRVPSQSDDQQARQIVAEWHDTLTFQSDEYETLIARIAAAIASRGAVPEWQPIETAPKDGTRILIGNKSDVVAAAWLGGDWVCDWLVGEYGDKPTHWMPLPAAPSPPEADGERDIIQTRVSLQDFACPAAPAGEPPLPHPYDVLGDQRVGVTPRAAFQETARDPLELSTWTRPTLATPAEIIEHCTGERKAAPAREPDNGVLQDDLRELLQLLGLFDGAQPKSPHEVFQDALAQLRKRLTPRASQEAMDWAADEIEKIEASGPVRTRPLSDYRAALTPPAEPSGDLRVGDQVVKFTGDYQLSGEVRASFTTRAGKVRYVVEHKPGFLHIYGASNLRPLTAAEPEPAVMSDIQRAAEVMTKRHQDELATLRARLAEVERERDDVHSQLVELQRDHQAALSRITELEAALRPFAEAADSYEAIDKSSEHWHAWVSHISIGDLRRAAAVIEKGTLG